MCSVSGCLLFPVHRHHTSLQNKANGEVNIFWVFRLSGKCIEWLNLIARLILLKLFLYKVRLTRHVFNSFRRRRRCCCCCYIIPLLSCTMACLRILVVYSVYPSKYVTIKTDSHIACRAHTFSLQCRAAKGLECVFPISFTQCGRVWFTLAMPCSDHAILLKATARPSLGGRAVMWPWEEWHGRSMAWQVWIRHGRTV